MPKVPKRLLQFLIILILILTPLAFWAKEVKAINQYYQPDIHDLNGQIQTINSTTNSTVINDTGIKAREAPLAIYAWTRLLGCTEKCNQQAANGTALGFLGNTIASIYGNPPASFALYAHDLLAHAGLAKEAYAQGIGFNAMSGLLPLWKASRNIAYSILVVVMVAIGFMVIFRMKMDPKTVISVQAAIPKIIITLILITFSYAIVGFLIDMMYVVMALVIKLMVINELPNISHPELGITAANIQTEYLTGGAWHLFMSVFGGVAAIPSLISAFSVQTIAVGTIVPLLAAGLGPIALLFIGTVPLILTFLVLLGLLFTFIRLLLLILNSYIQLLIALILGPILLLQEAIPGRSAFSSWILNVLANLSVFPTTAAVLLFGWGLSNQKLFWLPNASDWTPPFLGIATPSQNFIPAFLGLGVYFLAPNLVVSVKKLFQPKPTLPITAGTMLSPLTGAATTSMGAMQSFYYVQQPFTHGAGKGILERITNIGKERK